ncbi:copper chaperone CopZ [Paludifilum halophilum]|uniref:Copper chaperone CopZ n=1 Tax=Paludifilum halophilum TaxID=1642702 RepID=A0A235B9F2_9BACL|nr:copper chaperone CopZ [Paludifilum halophilum]OYD08918.1 copper-binding protein [Paludifilum halophilum]
MATTTLKVEGMTCDHCKQAVKGALEKVQGVKKAEVDLKEKTATVQYDESQANTDQMKEAVEDQGYDIA